MHATRNPQPFTLPEGMRLSYVPSSVNPYWVIGHQGQTAGVFFSPLLMRRLFGARRTTPALSALLPDGIHLRELRTAHYPFWVLDGDQPGEGYIFEPALLRWLAGADDAES